MRRIRRLRHQRGALEGLPLYLIILIVVAAIVVAILVGWLSTLQHPGINSLAVNVDGAGFQDVKQNAYPTCTPSSDSGCFTLQTSGACTFTVNPGSPGSGAPAEALIVTVTDKSGAALSNVQVTIAGVGISIAASPSTTATTGQTSGLGGGDAAFTSITGSIPQGDPSGGSISVTASYSSGGVTTTGSFSIPVEPPGQNTVTGASVSC